MLARFVRDSPLPTLSFQRGNYIVFPLQRERPAKQGRGEESRNDYVYRLTSEMKNYFAFLRSQKPMPPAGIMARRGSASGPDLGVLVILLAAVYTGNVCAGFITTC